MGENNMAYSLTLLSIKFTDSANCPDLEEAENFAEIIDDEIGSFPEYWLDEEEAKVSYGNPIEGDIFDLLEGVLTGGANGVVYRFNDETEKWEIFNVTGGKIEAANKTIDFMDIKI